MILANIEKWRSITEESNLEDLIKLNVLYKNEDEDDEDEDDEDEDEDEDENDYYTLRIY